MLPTIDSREVAVAGGRPDDGPIEEPQPSWLRRQLMKVFGPPDLGPEHQGNPLRGTKYDPEIKRAERERRKAERRRRRGL